MLTEVKQYLRIDGTEEDSLLSSLIDAAQVYITNAIGFDALVYADTYTLYTLAVCLLVAHWFENREVVGKADKLAYSLDSILFQLQYSGSDSL